MKPKIKYILICLDKETNTREINPFYEKDAMEDYINRNRDFIEVLYRARIIEE